MIKLVEAERICTSSAPPLESPDTASKPNGTAEPAARLSTTCSTSSSALYAEGQSPWPAGERQVASQLEGRRWVAGAADAGPPALAAWSGGDAAEVGMSPSPPPQQHARCPQGATPAAAVAAAAAAAAAPSEAEAAPPSPSPPQAQDQLEAQDQPEAEASESCVASGCSEPGSQTCSGCRSVRYCSPACQRSHWKAHKKACRLQQAVAAAAAGVVPAATD
jgi:hypothetical protein